MVALALCVGCKPAGPRALLQGKRLVEKGSYPEAIEKLKVATSILTTNAQAWNYLGLALHYGGQPAEAEKAYQRALLLDHDLSEAHFNLGCLWLEQNKPEAARNEFTAYTLRRGNSAESLARLGLAQLSSRDLGPPDKRAATAEKTFIEALRLRPQQPDALNGLGLVRVQQRHAADAIKLFNSALKERPDFSPALLNLGIVCQQHLQQRQAALQHYRQYLAVQPRSENTDAITSIIHQLEQELQPAPPALPASTTNAIAQAAPPITPPQKPPATNVTRVATAAPKPVVATNPPRPAAPSPAPKSQPAAQPVTEKVETQTVAPDTALKPAIDVASSSNVTSPSNVASPSSETAPGRYAYRNPPRPASGNRAQAEKMFSQAVTAQQSQKLSEAMSSYRSATQLDPSYFEAYYNLALTAAEAGNLPASLSAYESALAILPDSPDARYNFALILKRANYLTDAANELQKVLARYPNDARAHLALGNLYSQNFQEPAKARPHYLKVLDTDPGNPNAAAIRFWLAEHP